MRATASIALLLANSASAFNVQGFFGKTVQPRAATTQVRRRTPVSLRRRPRPAHATVFRRWTVRRHAAPPAERAIACASVVAALR